MTLRRKMTLQIAALLIGLLLVSAAALWGLIKTASGLELANEGYGRLRQVYESSTHLATAQKMLRIPHPQMLHAASEEVHAAATALDALPPADGVWDADADQAVRAQMRELLAKAAHPPDEPDAQYALAMHDSINDVLAKVPRLISGIRHTAETSQRAAEHRRRTTIATVATLCGIVVLVSTIVGIVQYRSVVRPLRRLGDAAHQIAAGQFQNRVEPRGGDELVALADDFNRMAGELDGLYRELERKVAQKSRELVRSERLASVGYLAAGVAHEINNPLGIISGYAEYSLTKLREGQPAEGVEHASANGTANHDDLEKSLRVICDEAFRCKEITSKLLSLVRGSAEGTDGDRKPVSMAKVAKQVSSLIDGLEAFKGRRLVLTCDDPETVQVQAVETEMMQVLLNLTVNALEAVPARGGEVRIEVARREQWVDVIVADNGRGMSAETIQRVFEPFFTEKRGRGEGAVGNYGTGLGLSITHAIVESHGGRIEAQSDGVAKGSRFVVTLPVLG